MKIAVSAAFALGIVWTTSAWGDCMERSVRDAKGADRAFVILVPTDDVPAFEKKGFTSRSCDLTPKQMTVARDNVCRMASLGNDAMQQNFRSVFGEEPKKMCAAAHKVLDSTAAK